MNGNVILIIFSICLICTGIYFIRPWLILRQVQAEEPDETSSDEPEIEDAVIEEATADGFDEDPYKWWTHNAGVAPENDRMEAVLGLLSKTQIEKLQDALRERVENEDAGTSFENPYREECNNEIRRQLWCIRQFIMAM